MTDDDLWLYLLKEWIPKGMGRTGPTLPFLLGARRVVGTKSGVADISELSALLYSFQRVTSHYVRIENCGNLQQPIAATYDRKKIMTVKEHVKLRKGDSSLYVSQGYPHQQDIGSAAKALWDEVGSAITTNDTPFTTAAMATTPRKISPSLSAPQQNSASVGESSRRQIALSPAGNSAMLARELERS